MMHMSPGKSFLGLFRDWDELVLKPFKAALAGS